MDNDYSEYEVTVQVRTTVSRLVEARDTDMVVEKVNAWLEDEGFDPIAYSIKKMERS